jgi:group I intron endonuclease
MVVYMARNTINNKMYIGKTVGTLKQRQSKHYRDVFQHNSQTHFHRALRKYGKDAFNWSIIQICENEQELKKAEIHLIDKFETFQNGYNMTLGGDGSMGYGLFGDKNPFYNKHHTPETLARLSDIGKQNISAHFKTGKENIMFGKHLTDDHKQALSDASSKKWLITFPDGSQTELKSLRKFSIQYGLNYNNVKSAKREGRPYKGYTFSEIKN